MIIRKWDIPTLGVFTLEGSGVLYHDGDAIFADSNIENGILKFEIYASKRLSENIISAEFHLAELKTILHTSLARYEVKR